MLAKKKLSVLMLSLAFSSAAWAGLGGIAVRSNLGEPLRAEIDFTGSDSELLRVGLASTDTFRDLKVDYAAALTSLRFTLAQRANGHSYIRVSSSAPISDPYLRFVVEARMPNGRSIREYTILLDPADYDSKADAAPRSQSKPVFEPELPSAAARIAPRAEPAAPRVPGTVIARPGQNLRQLAGSLGLHEAGIRQVMAALFEANPAAFAGGSPSHLRRGARLKVPALARIKSLSAEQVNQILGSARAPEHAAPAAKTAERAAPPAEKIAEKPAEKPQEKAAEKPLEKAAEKPAAAEHAPAKTEQVVKLEQVDASAALAAAEASAALSAQAMQLQQAQKKIAELEARLKAMQPASAAHAAAPAKDGGPSLLDSVMDYLPLIGGGVASALLAAAGIIMWRRRKASAAGSTLGAVLDQEAVGRMNMEAASGGNTFLTDFTRTSMDAGDSSDVDPIAEAEVYLAYGRDQQAEEILKDALVKDPTRHEVRAKLLEIYASRQDKASFENHAQALHAALDGKGALWDKVAKSGRAIDPANPLYGEAVAGEEIAVPAGQSGSAAMDIDLDSELMGELHPEPAAVSAAPADDDDPLRAALLGDDQPAAAVVEPVLAPELDIESLLAEPEPVAPEPVVEDNHMLDFDFHLDDPVVAATPVAEPAAEPMAAVADDNSVDFDFELGLDDGGNKDEAVSTEGMSVSDDPLATKLDLARVYLDMGDKDGAREVLEELIAEAEGTLQQDAANLLASL